MSLSRYTPSGGGGGSSSTISLDIYAALGSSIKAEPMYPVTTVIGSGALGSTEARIVAVRLFSASTITGVIWLNTQAGVYTANNYNGVGLYTYNAGTLTLVASSVNDGNIWKGTVNTTASKAFSSTYSAAAGIYFICALYCNSAQTSAPGIGVCNQLSQGAPILDFTNSAKISGSNFITSLPSTMSMANDVNIKTTPPYFALY